MGNDLELISAGDPNDLGPAMKALTPLQRNFVLAVKEIGRDRWSRCARIAGFQGTDNAVAVMGHRLSRNPKILAALIEIGGYTLQSAAADAAAALLEVMRNPAEPKSSIKLKAANSVLDRIGIAMKTEHTVNVNKTFKSEQVMLIEMRTLIENNPVLIEFVPAPIRKLLEAPKKAEVVDAEFTEVVDPDAKLLGL